MEPESLLNFINERLNEYTLNTNNKNGNDRLMIYFDRDNIQEMYWVLNQIVKNPDYCRNGIISYRNNDVKKCILYIRREHDGLSIEGFDIVRLYEDLSCYITKIYNINNLKGMMSFEDDFLYNENYKENEVSDEDLFDFINN